MKKEVNFAKARQGFRFHNETSNLSKRSYDWYDRKLKVFEEFLHVRYPDRTTDTLQITDVKTEDIREFIAHLQNRTTRYETHRIRKVREGGLSPHTIRGFARALSAFFIWAYKEHLISRKLTENVRWPKVPKDIKDIFTREEALKLLKACEEYPERLAAWNRALILFLLDTSAGRGMLRSDAGTSRRKLSPRQDHREGEPGRELGYVSRR